MTASADGQTCQKTGVITISGSSANFSQEYWVAAAAHAAGSLGSQWRTDLGLLNRQGTLAQVAIKMHVSGTTHQLTTSVGAGVQNLLDDVVGMMGVNGSGSLEISSNVPLYMTSRTYNQSSSGSFGQFLDGYAPSSGIGAGQTVYLPQLSENSAYRSNIGFVNTSGSSATVKTVLLSTNGTVLGQVCEAFTLPRATPRF